MKTEFFHIIPRGLGTLEAESFGSVFCRSAQSHAASIWAFLRLLQHWWQRTHGSRLSSTNNEGFFFCPTGNTLAQYVCAIAEGTGSDLIGRTTLNQITIATLERPHGVARSFRRWCPACFQEHITLEETPYERLLWQLAPITRCTLHRLELEFECPNCRSTQGVYNKNGELATCALCFRSLIPPTSAWRVAFRPSLGEVDCIELVERASAFQHSGIRSLEFT